MSEERALPGLYALCHGALSPAGHTKFLQRYLQSLALQGGGYIWVRARDVVGPELRDIPHQVFSVNQIEALPDDEGPHGKTSNLRESLKGTKGFENADLVRFEPETLDQAWRIISMRRRTS